MKRTENRNFFAVSFTFAPVRIYAGCYFGGFIVKKRPGGLFVHKGIQLLYRCKNGTAGKMSLKPVQTASVLK